MPDSKHQNDRQQFRNEVQNLKIGLYALFPSSIQSDIKNKLIDNIAQAIYNGVNAAAVNTQPHRTPQFPSQQNLSHDTNILAECVHTLAVDLIQHHRDQRE